MKVSNSAPHIMTSHLKTIMSRKNPSHSCFGFCKEEDRGKKKEIEKKKGNSGKKNDEQTKLRKGKQEY